MNQPMTGPSPRSASPSQSPMHPTVRPTDDIDEAPAPAGRASKCVAAFPVLALCSRKACCAGGTWLMGSPASADSVGMPSTPSLHVCLGKLLLPRLGACHVTCWVCSHHSVCKALHAVASASGRAATSCPHLLCASGAC